MVVRREMARRGRGRGRGRVVRDNKARGGEEKRGLGKLIKQIRLTNNRDDIERHHWTLVFTTLET